MPHLYLNLTFPTPTNYWLGVFDAWIQGDAQAFAVMLCDEMLKELWADGAQGTKWKRQVDNAESTDRKQWRNLKLCHFTQEELGEQRWVFSSSLTSHHCHFGPTWRIVHRNTPLKPTIADKTKKQCPALCCLLLVLKSSVKNNIWTEIEQLAVLTLVQIQQPICSETIYMPPDCWA